MLPITPEINTTEETPSKRKEKFHRPVKASDKHAWAAPSRGMGQMTAAAQNEAPAAVKLWLHDNPHGPV